MAAARIDAAVRTDSAGRGRGSTSRTTQRRTEPALLAAQIEQLPDRTGVLKIASQPEWVPVELRL